MALEATDTPAAAAPAGGLAAALERDILGTADGQPIEAAPPAAPIDPTPTPAPVEAPKAPRGKSKMAQAINDTLNPATPAATPPPAAPPVETPAATPAATHPADPLATLKPEDDPTGTKLPIEEETPPPENAEPLPADKAGYRIRELKGEIETHKAAIAAAEQAKVQAEARAAEAEAAAAEAVELKAKIAQYEKEMSVVKLEKTEAYQSTVQAPLDAIMKESAEIADRYELDIAKVDAILEMTDETAARAALKELLSGLDVDDDDKYALRELRKRTLPLAAKRAELYGNADAALLELQAQTEKATTAQIAARAEERRAAVPTVVDKIARWLPELKGAMEVISKETMDTDVDALPVDRRVYNHLAGRALAEAGKLYKTTKAQLDEALDQIARYEAAKPNPGGFTQANPEGNAPKSMADAMLKSLGM